MPREDQEEQEPAMTKYRFFMRWFSDNFITILDECWVTPTFVFQKALIDFAAVVLYYNTIQDGDELQDEADRNFMSKAVYNHLRQHFLHNWPTLQFYFERAIKKPGTWLSWQGSGIKILARKADVIEDLVARGMEEKSYLPNCNIFKQIDPSADDTPTTVNSQKQSQQDATPPPTPSSGTRHRRKRMRKSSAMVVD